MIGLKKWSARPRRVKPEFLPKQNRVLLLSNGARQIGTSQSTSNRQNNVLPLSTRKEQAFEVREEDRERRECRLRGDIETISDTSRAQADSSPALSFPRRLP